MIIVLESKTGKVIRETIKANNLDLQEAKSRFDSPLFTVVAVEEVKVGNLSNEKACRIISNEGIGYAVQSYIRGNEFADPETARLWNVAANSLDNLVEHLNYDEWTEDV